MAKHLRGNDEYLTFAQRTIKAAGKRVAEGDVASLQGLQELHDHVDAAIWNAVVGLLVEGYTLGEVARHLGVTKQAAYKRWHDAQHVAARIRAEREAVAS